MNDYPTLEVVDRADIESLLRWMRFLPSPAADEQLVVMNRIIARYCEERDKDPAANTRASKAIGWDR